MKTGAKKILHLGILSVFFLFIVIYAFFGSHNLIFGVKIKNVNMADGAKMENSILEITGRAFKATHLALNGREISIDEKGNFRETIALLSGYNIINIIAKDKFGYIDEKNYRIMY